MAHACAQLRQVLLGGVLVVRVDKVHGPLTSGRSDHHLLPKPSTWVDKAVPCVPASLPACSKIVLSTTKA
jgi:hypothetical protein